LNGIQNQKNKMENNNEKRDITTYTLSELEEAFNNESLMTDYDFSQDDELTPFKLWLTTRLKRNKNKNEKI